MHIVRPVLFYPVHPCQRSLQLPLDYFPATSHAGFAVQPHVQQTSPPHSGVNFAVFQ
ncbi:hypothetical protein [Nostoc favosum]|uniref:Uncharacterized protein n=1 Tax=Nostoc favosum CHAB5714 TaxID=2780399 RepID=A0ABS8I4T8_9NOSO|nr:hypothetical protein [Nostoc favosum]MCC5599193.1 hypothetical protein [Nostoc favosum CHAB5714]